MWFPLTSGNGNVVLRGGSFNNGNIAGLFNLGSNDPVTISAENGFRCVYRPNAVPVSKSFTIDNLGMDTESLITLKYGDVNEDVATSCSVSNLLNVTETTACSCTSGICSVGVTGDFNYIGAANFDYTVSDIDGESNISTVDFNISTKCPSGYITVDGLSLIHI